MRMKLLPIIIIRTPSNFFLIFCSPKTFQPKNTAIIPDNWNSANANPTFIRWNTIFVDNCIAPRQTAIASVSKMSFGESLTSLILKTHRRAMENKNPVKHHKMNACGADDIKIIFLITTASPPVRINAANLSNMSFRLII